MSALQYMGSYFLTDDDVALLKAMRKMLQGVSGPGVVNDGLNLRLPGKSVAKKPRTRPFELAVARVTGISALGAGWYSARSQRRNETNYNPATALNLANYFLDAQGSDDVYVQFVPESAASAHSQKTDGTLYVIGYWDGTSTGSNPRPVLVAVGAGSATSIGQYQYQVNQMVAQNVAGWDFTRAHPLL